MFFLKKYKHVKMLIYSLPVFFAGCFDYETDSYLNMEISVSLPPYADIVSTNAHKYIDKHFFIDEITADFDCDDTETTACLLRIQAQETVQTGSASSFVMNIATEIQPLPGVVDFVGLSIDPYIQDPIIYSVTDEVVSSDMTHKYNYICEYIEGDVYLFDYPAVDSILEGQFDNITLECRQNSTFSDTIPVVIKGMFRVLVSRSIYSLFANPVFPIDTPL